MHVLLHLQQACAKAINLKGFKARISKSVLDFYFHVWKSDVYTMWGGGGRKKAFLGQKKSWGFSGVPHTFCPPPPPHPTPLPLQCSPAKWISFLLSLPVVQVTITERHARTVPGAPCVCINNDIFFSFRRVRVQYAKSLLENFYCMLRLFLSVSLKINLLCN